MSELIADFKQLIALATNKISANFDQELYTAGVLFIVFLFFLFVQNRAKKYVTKDKVFSFYEFLLLDLVLPLLYIFFVQYSSIYLGGRISQVFFTVIAYLYIGNSLIQSGFLYSDKKDFSWKVVTLVLLTLGLLSLLFIKLNVQLLKSPYLALYLFALFKLSLIFLIYILLYLNINRIVSGIPDSYKLLNAFFSRFIKVFTPLYFIISLLWLVKIISFTGNFFIGFVVSLIGVALYSITRFYIRSNISTRVSINEGSYAGLVRNINIFLTLLLFLFLYSTFKGFFNLGFMVDYLKGSMILNTDIIKISVYALLASFFILAFLLALINIMKHAVHFFYTKRGMDIEADSVRQLVFNLGLLLVAVVFLSRLGFSWKALLPIAGALGIGIGIGLQNIMNNYISGFILLFSRKLKMGDIVELEGNAGKAIGSTLETVYGKVSDINLLSTLVHTTDGIEIIVPNSHFIEQKIVNYSLTDQFIRLRIPFGVSYESDPNTVKEILLKVAKNNTSILKTPEPGVWFTEMADSALIFNLLVWVDIRVLWKLSPIISETYFEGWYKLKEAGVVIPFPQRDVWFKNRVQIDLPDELIDNLKNNKQ